MEDQPWTSTKFQPPTVLDTYTFSTQPLEASDPGLHAISLAPAHITVRNPPRAHLPPASDQFCEDVEQARFPEKSFGIRAGRDTHPVTSELSSPVPSVSRRQSFRMPKKRPSLHSLFTPSFLSPPISPTSSDFDAEHLANDYILRARSSSSMEQVLRSHMTTSQHDQSPTLPSVTSPRNSPPPAFLIDDDPFANLTTLPSVVSLRHTPPPPPSSLSPPTSPRNKAPPTPRSPLTPSTAETNSISFTRSSSTNALPSGISRTLSGRAIPAHQKPAFSSRPSLPSLHTLAKMDAVFTPKVRKGRVGAKLPAEPWDNLHSPQTTSATSLSNSQDPTHSFSPPVPSGIADFVSNLDSDFLDFSSDDDMDEMESTHQFYSSNYDTVLEIFQFDSISNIDGETSMSDLSPPSLSRTSSSSLSSLTRSTSLTSTSSAGSSETHQWPSSLSHSNSMSSVESDSDILNSPPDEYLSFSTSRNSSNTITDRLWPSHTRLDMIDLEIDPHDSPFSDVRYIRESEVMYEPGTSAGTLRPSMDLKKTDPESHPGSLQMDDDEVVDGVGSEGHGGNSPSFSVGKGAGETGGRANGGNEGQPSGNGRGRLGGRGDDDENDPRRHNYSTFSTPSDSERSDEDESTDDYGEESVLDVASQSSSDDDVPLAQRIPTALQAQRALRRQVREERDNRRKERALRAEQGASTRSRQLTLRPGAGDPSKQSNMSSSQEAALHASMSMRRPRTKTLSSNTARPFSPEDLSRRLQVMEVAGTSTTRHYRSPSASVKPQEVVVENVGDTGPVSHLATETHTTRHYRSPSMSVKPKAVSVERPGSAGRTLADTGHASLQPSEAAGASTVPPMPNKSTVADRSRSAGRSVGGFGHVPHNPLLEGHRALRLMRSFHIPERRKVDDHISAPMPAEQKLARSLTRTRPRGDSAGSHSHSQSAHLHPLSDDKVPPRRSGDEFRKLVKANPESKSARPSMEFERPSRPSIQRPPVPPLPPAEALVNASTGRGNLTQQRIFIGDMQRFNTVEISPSTNGGDVIEMVEAQGSLKGWVGVGNWMVWEFAQDFGMERPIRNFELLADIQASWNKDKMLNAFVIKLTPLAGLLSRSVIPSSSPMHAGYVDWESKRGKWTKRWLQLREHNLYLSKRDNGRDEVLLCSLSNFDAYFITRLHRSPQPFVFAVKSTDNLSFFENKADYLHVFCCGENQGKVWMEKILVARSYVLHQEKHVLFSPKASNGNAAGGALTRTGTRKASSARPPQPSSPHTVPLVSLARNDVFEPGSLLHKQI